RTYTGRAPHVCGWGAVALLLHTLVSSYPQACVWPCPNLPEMAILGLRAVPHPWYRTFSLVKQGFSHRTPHPPVRRRSPTRQPCQQPLHKIFDVLWTTLCTVFLSWFTASAPGPKKIFQNYLRSYPQGHPKNCGQHCG